VTGAAAALPLFDHALLVGSPDYGELVLVRHAQQGVNALNDPARPKGGDAPLSDLGLRQAVAVADELAHQRVDAVYCSHLERAQMTAAQIADRHGLEPVVDAALAEVGVYRDIPAGRTVADELGPQGVAHVRRTFTAQRCWDVFPLSEQREELQARIAGALGRIMAAHAEATRVVVVCHGGVINAVLRGILDVPTDMFFFPAHASLSRVGRGDGRLALRSVNETGHLQRRPGVEVTF